MNHLLDALGGIGLKDILLVALGLIGALMIEQIRLLTGYRLRYKQVSLLVDKKGWHAYHFSRANYGAILRREKWTIKRTLRGVEVETEDGERAHLSYKGRVAFDSAHVVLELTSVNHKEIAQYRLTAPIPNEDARMIGFTMAEDFDHELYAGITIVSQRELSDKDATEAILGSVLWHSAEGSIRLSKKAVAPPTT